MRLEPANAKSSGKHFFALTPRKEQADTTSQAALPSWKELFRALFNIRFNAEDDRKPSPDTRIIIADSGLFDEKYYLAQNVDVARATDPLDHFINFGVHEFKNPCQFFDVQWYLLNNQDVERAKVNPLVHYIRHGSAEGRKPHPDFDPQWYLSTYTDVRDAGAEPLAHFIRHGVSEGRRGSAGKGAVTRALTLAEVEIQKRNLSPAHRLRPVVFAIGIATYNNDPTELSRCLRSAEIALEGVEARAPHLRLLIDNGAPTDKRFVEKHQFVSLGAHGNKGFSVSQNLLMDAAFAAGADYFIAANPDGVFHSDSIKDMLGMAQACDGGVLIEALQFPDEHPKVYDPISFETPWASGACLMISREVYETIGGFDERFFMYCDDVDFSWRARAAGFKAKTCPTALFFYQTIDRPYDALIEERFLTSGIFLARKWSAPDFETLLRKRAAAQQIMLPEIARPEPERETGVADLKHLFSFAETRW
jgi:hypothetical protein